MVKAPPRRMVGNPLRRLPRGVNIAASALPKSAATQASATSILTAAPVDASTQLLPQSPGLATVTPAMQRRAINQQKRQLKQMGKINKYNQTLTAQAANLSTGMDKPIDYSNVAANTSTVLDPIDWSVTGGSPSGIAPSSGITDASRLLAPNMPTLPNIGPADIRRERNKNKKLQQSINRINRFNEVRNKQAASLALGLDSPVDYSNVLPGGQADPNAVLQNPDPYAQQQQQQYPLYPGAPATPGYPPPGYPQQPQPMPGGMYPSPGYEPYVPPMASQPMGSPMFSSQILGEQGYTDPGIMGYSPAMGYDPSMAYAAELAMLDGSGLPWQESVPFDLPNMSPDGELQFMEPNMSGERSMDERFAAYGDFWDYEPLDTYAAFSAEPSQTNFWSGLTGLVQGGATAYTTNQNAKATAQANLLAQQAAARKAAAAKQPGMSSGAMIGIGVGVLVLVGVLAMRRGK